MTDELLNPELEQRALALLKSNEELLEESVQMLIKLGQHKEAATLLEAQKASKAQLQTPLEANEQR